MLLRIAPLIFVLIWSGAFVAARGGLPDFTPWALLSIRFVLAALLLLVLALCIREKDPDWRAFRQRWAGVVGAGVLMNGLYLGLFFTAMQEVSAATTALVGSLTPILTALISGPVLGERFSPLQWLGFLLGILGVGLVAGMDYLTLDVGVGLAAAFAGVLSMTFGTIWHAYAARGLPLLATNATQMAASAVLCLVIMGLVETPRIDWTPAAFMALGYLTIGVSLGGMGLYLLMLKHGAAGKVASNFYLTPAVAAILAFLILGETLRPEPIAGFVVAMAGIWLVQRKPAAGGSKPD